MNTPSHSRAIIPDAMADIARDWRMAPGVVTDGILRTTGWNGAGLTGPVPADPAAQIENALSALDMVLAQAGCTWDDVIEMTSYHVGLADHLDLFRTCRAARLGSYAPDWPGPSWTAIEVSGFATPDVIVEVSVVACVPST